MDKVIKMLANLLAETTFDDLDANSTPAQRDKIAGQRNAITYFLSEASILQRKEGGDKEFFNKVNEMTLDLYNMALTNLNYIHKDRPQIVDLERGENRIFAERDMFIELKNQILDYGKDYIERPREDTDDGNKKEKV